MKTTDRKSVTIGYAKPSMEAATKIMNAVLAGDIAQANYVREFEEKFAKFIGRKFCIACSSGTSALSVALAALRNDHLDTPNATLSMRADTYPSTANAAYAAGYRNYKFYDCDEGASDADVKIITDVMGEAQYIPASNRSSGSVVIEDACEALGSVSEDGYQCGADPNAFAACFSFFVTHTLSSGEGGAIVCDDSRFAEDCRALRDHGRWGPAQHWAFLAPGFNAKMTSLEAILASDALDQFPQTVDARIANTLFMDNALGIYEDRNGVVPHAYTVYYESKELRDDVLIVLDHAGIEARAYFPCLPKSTWASGFCKDTRKWPVSEERERLGLYVPIHEGLHEEQLELMATTLNRKGLVYRQEEIGTKSKVVA